MTTRIDAPPPDHDAFKEATGLYVLGGLSGEERARFEAHLDSCEICAAEVGSLRHVVQALSFGVPQVEPPAALKSRVMEAARRARPATASGSSSFDPGVTITGSSADRGRRGPTAWPAWLAMAASLALAVGLGGYAATLRGRLQDLQQRLIAAVTQLQASQERLDAANRETAVIRTSLAMATAPDGVELRLAGQAPARQASARAFLSRSRGLLFAATNLPPLPANRIYQVWFLTPGAPVSAGLLRPDADGNATVALPLAAGAPNPTGLAVSIEPEGGVPAPTGAIYLATE